MVGRQVGSGKKQIGFIFPLNFAMLLQLGTRAEGCKLPRALLSGKVLKEKCLCACVFVLLLPHRTGENRLCPHCSCTVSKFDTFLSIVHTSYHTRRSFNDLLYGKQVDWETYGSGHVNDRDEEVVALGDLLPSGTKLSHNQIKIVEGKLPPRLEKVHEIEEQYTSAAVVVEVEVRVLLL